MDEKWEWFCGVNSTDLYEWDEDVRNNTCLLDGLVTIPHAAFLLLSSLVLLVVGCCTGYRRVHTKYLLVYSGHSVRWLLSMLLLVVVLASIGEGIMTDETYQAWQQPTQPHLYVHSIVAFAAVALSLVYYHHMELWQLPSMSLLLFLYWAYWLCMEVVRTVSLVHQDSADVHNVLFDLTLVKLVALLFLVLFEGNVVLSRFCCRSGTPYPEDLKDPDMLCMHYYVSLFSALTYWWANWLLALGYKKHLDLSDLGVVPERHEAKYNHEKFRTAFLEESAKSGGEASLYRVYMKVYGKRLIGAAILKLIGEIVFFINPLAVGALTSYVTTLKYPPADSTIKPAHQVTVDEFFHNGFVLVGIMFLASIVNFLCLQTHFYIAVIEGLNVRAAIQTMVYEKALRLSTVATTGGKMNMGQITNHMSVDPNAIQFMFQYVNNLWAIPIQLIINLVLLYVQMGYPSLIGASVFLFFSPVQLRIAAMIGKQQKELLVCSDERLKKTNELLQGIKLLKLYGWEGLYCRAIEVIRSKELHYLLKINVGFVTTVILTLTAPVLVMIVGFGTYTALTGEPLTPEVTFSALPLFNQLTMPLMMLPLSLLQFINGVVSTNRVQKFLAAQEIEDAGIAGFNFDELRRPTSVVDSAVGFRKPDHVRMPTSGSDPDEGQLGDERSKLLLSNKQKKKASSSLKYGAAAQNGSMVQNGTPKKRLPSGVAIKISDGNFLWDPASNIAVLQNINVEIPEGKLTVIIGQVGSGKSSLLSAMLGEMTTISGTVQVRNRNRVALAAQKPWLINSSLQENILFSLPLDEKRYKRVIDASALRPDIDILPGGDQTEIGEKGINLSGGQKQRVSVARTMYSGRDIVILDDPLSALDVHVGNQLFTDGIQKLLVGHKQTVILVTHQLQYLNRADLIIEMKDGKIAAQGNLDDIIASDPDMYSEYNQAVLAATEESEGDQSGYESEGTRQERLRLQKIVKKAVLNKQQLAGDNEEGALIEKEEIERGSVSMAMYWCYIQNFGVMALFLASLFAVLFTGFAIGKNFWLSAWAESGMLNVTDANDQFADYFGGYVGLAVANLLAKLISTALIVYGVLRAARKFHEQMLRNIIKVPLRFFDTTPIGRVLNRFSNDTQLLDMRMTQTINVMMGSFLNVVSAVVVNTIVMPIFLAFFAPVGICYYFLQRYFLASSRELQRLDSISKSPVFAYFSESLNGLATIRAYECGERFYRTLVDRINANLSAFLYLQIANRWLAVRLDFLGAVIVLIAGMSTLIGALTAGLDPSLVGLAVTYVLQVAGFLNFYVRTVTEMEMQMNATERIRYYTCIENEQYEGEEPPPDWPQEGQIRMDRVSVRYAQNTDTVLRNISLNFKAGHKIGVCGRTGAGKSSMTLALLRVIDIFQGRILIDGIDIKSVPLSTLRRKLSIIPQDPVLFTGTIRHNLDPVGHISSDEELWRALDIAQLKDVVTALDGGLEFMVTEGGENFSVGQRQLFCLARAFLRKSRILIMDEATASIDLETDKILQGVVARAFADRTVLTIAHRITTILSSDVIVVLEEGRLVEYGPPDDLLRNEDGIFASFVLNKE